MYTNSKLPSTFVLSDREYSTIRDIVYESAGISLGDNKKELVHARLSKIMRKRGISGFSEYIKLLADDSSGNELVTLMDAISTNVTHFFRENQHFEFLTQTIRENGQTSDLAIWSAGCSSGEEPYTLAITLAELFGAECVPKPFILATDLSTKVLDRAVRAVFPFKAVEALDRQLLRRYFLKGKNGSSDKVKVKPSISSMVKFKRLNLIEPFSFSSKFDYIFCRNVMIYFDNTTRTQLVDKFYESLNPGGYLLIGHSESLNGLSHRFKYIKPTIYRKS